MATFVSVNHADMYISTSYELTSTRRKEITSERQEASVSRIVGKEKNDGGVRGGGIPRWPLVAI